MKSRKIFTKMNQPNEIKIQYYTTKAEKGELYTQRCCSNKIKLTINNNTSQTQMCHPIEMSTEYIYRLRTTQMHSINLKKSSVSCWQTKINRVVCTRETKTNEL